jgi:stromal membrane-associated protein
MKTALPKTIPPKAAPTKPSPSVGLSYKPASAPPGDSTRPSLSHSATAPPIQPSPLVRSNTASVVGPPVSISTPKSFGSQQFPQNPSKDPMRKPSNNPVWDDLISLQAPSQSASLPLQFTTPASLGTPSFTGQQQLPGSYGTLSASYQPASFTGIAPAMTGSFPSFQPQRHSPLPFTSGLPVVSPLPQQPFATGSGSFGIVSQPSPSLLSQQFMVAPSQPQMQATAQLFAPQPLYLQQQPTSTFLSASPSGQPMQLPQQPSPFNQHPSPAHLSQPPSPYVNQLSLPQFQQSLGQQPLQTAAFQHGNPMGGWTTQEQQMNFPQQQWGVM